MKIGIIGALVDLGADRRGVDMGASAIRYAGLVARLRECGHDVKDYGNIPAPERESAQESSPQLKYLEPIVDVCKSLAGAVESAMSDGYVPIVLGGDHSVSLGSVGGVTRRRNVGVIWLDAHGDFNTPLTSPSGNIHGMVLSALTGHGDERLSCFDGRLPMVDPHNVALIGVRELDSGERDLLHGSGVQVFTMHDIDAVGLPGVVRQALAGMGAHRDGLHISLDLDVVDPLQAPGVGTPVLGGLSYRETHLAMELLYAAETVVSMDVVEVNPILDTHNETARLAVEFTLSALGKGIY